MWLRRAFFRWLIPAAFVLPAWLFVGWGVFNAGAWAFLWVLFIAIPSVLVGQLLLALLVRARPTVRESRAVSWLDVAGFAVWHLLTISLGFFRESWWAPVMVLTIFVGVALLWLTLWQLWREAKPGRAIFRAADGTGYIPPMRPRPAGPQGEHEVIVITETSRGAQ
jgi:hypothetical protein